MSAHQPVGLNQSLEAAWCNWEGNTSAQHAVQGQATADVAWQHIMSRIRRPIQSLSRLPSSLSCAAQNFSMHFALSSVIACYYNLLLKCDICFSAPKQHFLGLGGARIGYCVRSNRWGMKWQKMRCCVESGGVSSSFLCLESLGSKRDWGNNQPAARLKVVSAVLLMFMWEAFFVFVPLSLPLFCSLRPVYLTSNLRSEHTCFPYLYLLFSSPHSLI